MTFSASFAAIPDTPMSGGRVARELTRLIENRGKPQIVVSDRGTELSPTRSSAWPRITRRPAYPRTPRKGMLNGQAVFASRIPIVVLGLDVTRNAVIPASCVDEIAAHGTPVAVEAARVLRCFRAKDPCLHNPAAMAWITSPEIFQSVPAHVSIETGPGPGAGQVVAAVSERHLAGRMPNCTIVTDLDAAALAHLLKNGLTSISAACDPADDCGR